MDDKQKKEIIKKHWKFSSGTKITAMLKKYWKLDEFKNPAKKNDIITEQIGLAL